MADRWARPDVEQLIAAHDHLFRSSLPLSRLRDAAFGGRLFDVSTSDDGVPGRSMAWKLFLIPTVPLSPPAHETPAKPPLVALRKLRDAYVALLLEKMRAPDGSYEDGFSLPGVPALPRRASKTSSNLQQNNPLSLDDDNPWRDWFAAMELRNTIRQDVERTFPDISYFRDPEVQLQLTNILFIHSTMHPTIGYRQGMHELLAPVLYALDFDSLSEDADCDADLKNFSSRTWIAADAWALFGVIMQNVGTWYEWRELPPAPLSSPLKTQFRHGASEGQVDLKPYVAPIVQACQHLQSNLLKTADPTLWQSMQAAGIEPQIYGIRWLRLLFTREFSLPDAMILWDGIVAADGSFELVPWICVAMLIRIRNKLIPSDYSGQLTCLLRYPSSSSDTDPSCPHPANLLLRQALALQISPNPSTGASIVIENRNLLNIPIEVPEAPPPPMSRRVRSVDRPGSISIDPRVNASGSGSGGFNRHRREESAPQAQQMGLPELIARGLLERGESLGINRTVMNAVSEIRKNLPDMANHLIRSPSASSSSYTSFPLIDERPPDERPPWEPKTRLEVEKEILDLRALHKRLGESVGLAVDALLQDEGDDKVQDKLKMIRERKREAIECLAYVRDVLGGSAEVVEDERLFGEEESKRRKLKIQKEKEAFNSDVSLRKQEGTSEATSSSPVLPPLPAAHGPVAPNDRRPRAILSSRESQHPLSALPRTPPVSKSPPEVLPTFSRLAATLPRRGPSSNTPSSTPVLAPWNYTPSNFSGSSITTLPRPPPRTSSSFLANSATPPLRPVSAQTNKRVAPDQAPRRQEIRHDPLGVLP